MEIINLDMTPSTVTPNAHAGQYDASRTVRFMLKNGGVPFTLAGTETITAEITRSDNTEVTVNVANTSSNYVDVVFDDTVCTVKGLYACELRVVDGGVDIGSKNFALLVQRDPYDGAGVHVETVGPADICTFETTLPEPLQSVLVNVLATGGNGTPDSPIPINGYTEANITRCGVNLFKNTFNNTTINQISYTKNSDGSMSVSGTATGGFAQAQTTVFLKAGNYIISDNCTFPRNSGLEFYCNASPSATTRCNDNVNFTVTKDGVYNVYIYVANGVNIDTTIYPMIRRASVSDTTYHPYNGQTYAIAFGQTVYGGVLDVTRGKLSVDRAYIKMTSALGYLYGGSAGQIWFNITNPYIPSTTSEVGLVTSSHFKSVSQSAMITDDNCVCKTMNNTVIWFKSATEGWTSVDEFKTWLDTQEQANTPVELVYKIATPFDIDLTPKGISAVVGTNNVFADCGQMTVKYLKAGV